MLVNSLMESPVSAEALHPWDGLTIYQIYPTSFAESGTSRGEGNLQGIVDKLDYMQGLGVDAIWVSPFYPSPMVDGGYDVTDHCDVDPRFGTLEIFDRLVAECHDRGLKVMVDLVLNHTSDQHPKFLEESQTLPEERDPASEWYIWRDGPISDKGEESPPSNWASAFSVPNLERRRQGELAPDENGFTPPVSAWKYHPGRGQWYLRTFAAEQPDLNWENPEVRAEVQSIRANQLLKTMAEQLGEELPKEIVRAIQLAPASMEALWDDETQQYYNRDAVSGRLIKLSSISTFMPLYAKVLPKERVRALLAHLRNPKTFGASYPVPSTPLDSPYFKPNCYWQGPTWVNTNWLLIDGLRRNGQVSAATKLAKSTLDMVEKSGFHEYFSPLDVQKAGANGFSWTAALYIDLVHQLKK